VARSRVNGWLVGRRPSRALSFSLSLSLCLDAAAALLSFAHPLTSAATRRKSLRLTGSHGITGTRDIYASAPTDRSITRNKEIANLLQQPPPTTPRAPLRCRRPPIPQSSFLFFDIVGRRVEGGSRSESYFGFYGSGPPWVIRQRSR